MTNGFSKKQTTEKKHKKQRRKVNEVPKICCMTLQQKIDEVSKGSSRNKDLIDSIRNDINKITQFNFVRYLPFFITAYRNHTSYEYWSCFEDKMSKILLEINPTFFSPKNVDTIRKNFFGEKTIMEIINKRLQEIHQTEATISN